MTKTSDIQTQMRCPNCRSSSTQSVAIAYARSARVSESGYETISRLGQLIAPPREKDEAFWPGVVACIAATVALFKLPGILSSLEIEGLHSLRPLSWPVVLLSCIAGWLAGLILAIPAIHYNAHIRPGQLAEWERGMICSRCGHRWHRHEREGYTERELGNGA